MIEGSTYAVGDFCPLHVVADGGRWEVESSAGGGEAEWWPLCPCAGGHVGQPRGVAGGYGSARGDVVGSRRREASALVTTRKQLWFSFP